MTLIISTRVNRDPQTEITEMSRVATATDYTVKAGDELIGVTSTAAPRAITIPTGQLEEGRVLIIKDESGAAGTNNITITPAAEKIDGASSLVIDQNYGIAWIYCNGANWFILNKAVYA